jgi:hypothetical protein
VVSYNSDQLEGSSGAPSYEDANVTPGLVRFTHDARRLYWTMSGPLTSAIYVMDDKWYDPEVPLEQYCLQTQPTLTWASIAQSPLTEPKISSVSVYISPLHEWEDDWMELHAEHGEPDEEDALGSDFIHFGPLPDYSSDSDEEGPQQKLLCCGEKRPRKTKVKLEVTAAGPYLTVHDYVSAVHPWVLGLRERIVQAFEFQVDGTGDAPFDHDAKFMIALDASPDGVIVVEEEGWKVELDKKRNLGSIQQMAEWKRQKALEYQQLSEEQSWGYNEHGNMIQ